MNNANNSNYNEEFVNFPIRPESGKSKGLNELQEKENYSIWKEKSNKNKNTNKQTL